MNPLRVPAEHPFVSALAVVVIVAVPGYAVQQHQSDQLRDVSHEQGEIIDRLETIVADNEAARVAACEKRNAAWDAVINFVAQANPDADPEQLDALREVGKVQPCDSD